MKPITPREADAIEAALRASRDVEAIAQSFGRKRETIMRMKHARGIG